MQKDKAAWLTIRILGLLCLGTAACMAFGFVMNVIAVFAFGSAAPVSGDTLRLLNLRLDPLLGAFFFAALSVYLLRFGQVVHGWLIREGERNEDS
ncbi:MAG: hypothetical protein LAT61_03125 [Alcanivorax sp.]|nr:hypothetical protein [Alcanivorax sp.]